jgi:hypothetical protein
MCEKGPLRMVYETPQRSWPHLTNEYLSNSSHSSREEILGQTRAPSDFAGFFQRVGHGHLTIGAVIDVVIVGGGGGGEEKPVLASPTWESSKSQW